MGYLLGIIAAILWGLKPPTISLIKSKAIIIQLGTAIAVLLFSLIVFFCTYNTSINDLFSNNGHTIILYSFLSGLFWAIGQFFQFLCYVLLSTSIGFALSTATTLISNALLAVILFQDWKTPQQLILGFSALAIIIIGAIFTTYKKEKSNNKASVKNYILGILFAVIAGILFAFYSNLPRYATSVASPTSSLLPHGIGTFIGSIFAILIYYLIEFKKHKKDPSFEITSLKDIKLLYALIPGLLSSGANILLIYANTYIGSAIAYTLTQMAVIISTLISLFILKEYKNKTKREIIFILIGVVLILIGGILIGLTKM